MKISVLIGQLEDVRAKYGDLTARVWDGSDEFEVVAGLIVEENTVIIGDQLTMEEQL